MKKRRALFAASTSLFLSCGPGGATPVRSAPSATTPPVGVAEPAPPTLRLPAVAKPSRYDLDLTLDPTKERFSGVISADLDIVEPTPVLWLNGTDLTVTRAELAVRGETLRPRVIPGGEDFVGFAFERALMPGKARLTIAFDGKVDKERALGIYSQAEAGGDAYIYTFFEPIDARRAFPCFDEPAYKVPWKLTLHVKREQIARANTAVAEEKAEPDGMKAVSFEESRPLPSYLVAFVVGPFDVVNAPDAGHHATPLRFIVPRGRGAETRYAAAVTPKIIGLLEDYFGMPYPYGKLDVAVPPRYWGTMEHPGLVALGQPLTLIKPDEETIGRKRQYAQIASHELAHYWFGDYVTMQWWDETWLNESLTQWMDAKITDALEPSWKLGRERLTRARSAMRADGLPSAKRVREPVLSKNEIANAFDGELTYNKGATLLGMFESWMGAPALQRAMRAYMAKHAWRNATADDLFAALDAEGGPAISASMRTFVDQPGVPLVRVEVACLAEKRELVVSQQRYAPAGVTLPDEEWKIPVCVRYGVATGEPARVCTMLTGPSARVPMTSGTCPTWVMANEDAAGYYRAEYTKPMLAALLGAKRLRPSELASVVGDAAALVRSGHIALGDVLELLPSVVTSKDRYVVGASLSALWIAIGIATKEQAGPLAHYLRVTFGARAKALGWARKPGEDTDDEILRPELIGVVANFGRDPVLRAQAHDLALKWLRDRRALDPDLVSPGLAAAAKTNDRALFTALLAEAKKTADRREKQQLYTALGAFTEPALVKEAQALMLSSEVDLRDTSGILWAQLEDRDTRDAAYAFFEASFDAMSTRMRADEAMWLFDVPGEFCDDAHVEAAKSAFTARAQKTPGAPRTLEGALERARLCIAQARAHGMGLDVFLKRHGVP